MQRISGSIGIIFVAAFAGLIIWTMLSYRAGGADNSPTVVPNAAAAEDL